MDGHSLFVLLIIIPIIHTELRFTNIKCETRDPSFSDFEYCYLKSINRTYKYFSLKVRLYKIPVTVIHVGFALSKKESGYKPFLYNFTIDGCKYLKSPKNRLITFFYEIFKVYSNINHTCPFNHDIIVDKLNSQSMDNSFTRVLPFPSGDYIIHSSWYAYNILRATVN
ncbi:uncharacterized protein LOC119677951, partial [Teleopsis dalmanni]|uniref:uncharacterized protein LOC119677951 n=1 Tax=Teleopsis dalmanni TaxID=139649 RepID=UPI0018CC8C8F